MKLSSTIKLVVFWNVNVSNKLPWTQFIESKKEEEEEEQEEKIAERITDSFYAWLFLVYL